MKKTYVKELTELKESLEKEFPSLRKTVTRNLSASIFALILLLIS